MAVFWVLASCSLVEVHFISIIFATKATSESEMGKDSEKRRENCKHSNEILLEDYEYGE
jgi:hypothetical protein